MTAAIHLDKLKFDVILLEKEKELLSKATKFNQNRVHLGYHYPRSFDTAEQALNSYSFFCDKFKNSIVKDFDNYYMVAKNSSNINFTQFLNFCKSVGLEYIESLPSNKKVNIDLIENSIKVKEPVFDYFTLKKEILNDLRQSNVKIMLNANIDLIEYNNKQFNLTFKNSTSIASSFVINCTYSGINDVLAKTNDKLDLKFQDVILPIFNYNAPKFGLTVMDGPFCSVLPKGNDLNSFILSNVKKSVLCTSTSNNLVSLSYKTKKINEKISEIYASSSLFFPFLKNIEHHTYWRTTKALPINNDDARVSSIFIHSKYPNFISILQGKISTCFEIANQVGLLINNSKL